MQHHDDYRPVYWPGRNPWQHSVLLLRRTLYARTLFGWEKYNRLIGNHGICLDFYLLPQPEARWSVGVRYGPKGPQYSSPHPDYVNIASLFSLMLRDGADFTLGKED